MMISHTNEKEKVIKTVMKSGEILLHNGAEIFRVEETMIRIAKAYGADSVDVYAVSNGIFITISLDGNSFSTHIKHIPIGTVNLGRVAAVNQLSREIEVGKYTVDQAYEELKKIAVIAVPPDYIRVLFAGLGSGAFGYLLGGTLYDSIVSFIAGLFMYIFIIFAERKGFPKVLKIVIGSAGVTLISLILFSLGMGNSLDNIIIGSIITLVPGVALTTSVRDFFNGDYMAGTIHLVDTLMVGISIAVGVSVVLWVWNMIF